MLVVCLTGSFHIDFLNNTPESDYKLYIHKADYKCKRPIIYSKADYIFLMALSHWLIQQIEIKIIIQKIEVKTSS